MMFYVEIKKLIGRQDHVILGDWLNQSGTGEVQYHEGGWEDKTMCRIAPHLMFSREDDAVAYALAHKCRVTKTVPMNTYETF